MEIKIYTDGGCSPNPGVGGWGAILIAGKHKKSIRGGYRHTTNNRMEIISAIKALELVGDGKEKHTIVIYSDSQYLVKTIMNGWRKRKNQDLWNKLQARLCKHHITFQWVRGHSNNELNNQCDQLALLGRQETENHEEDILETSMEIGFEDTDLPDSPFECG